MKNFLLLLMLGSAMLVQAQEFNSPVDYFDFLNQQHSNLATKNLEYVQYAVHSNDVNVVENKRLEVVKQLAQAVVNVSGLPDYQGDDQMRAQLADVLKVYLESFEIELNEINILKNESTASFAAMEKYFEAQAAVEKKLGDAADSFIEAQRAFAKRHNIILEDAAANSTIAQINKVNDYYRVLFLKYFKVTKLNAAFMDALDKSDAAAMETARVALANNAAKEHARLQQFPDFKGNTNFRDVNKEIIGYYENIAKKDYQILVMVTQKEEEALTQKDVDAYNRVIGEYNVKSQELSGKYNTALDNLLKNNVPKPSIETKRL